MTGDRITEWVLVGTALLWLAWEGVIVWKRKQGERWKTISMVLQRRAYEFSIIPWSFGVLCGHWWWNVPNTEPIRGEPWIYIGLVWLTAMVGVADWLKFRRHPALVLVVGIIAGHFLWPQRWGGL